MSNGGSSRSTQVMSRSVLEDRAGVENISTIVRMIENGDEARRVFAAIADGAAKTDGVTAAALFLPSDRNNTEHDLVASSGNFPSDQGPDSGEPSSRIAMQSVANHRAKVQSGDQHYFDIICLGAPIGSLAVVAADGVTHDAQERLNMLAHHAAVAFERHKLSSTLQHFLDRLQVLNELNQLIASNIGLQRLVKTLARESAFRFASDVSLTLLLDDEKKYLLPKGGYGCTPNLIPKKIDVSSGILGQVMRMGGYFSVENLEHQQNHGLNFLTDLGIRAVDVCCLEVRGEALGAMLIGFRREDCITQNDLTRFEEFSHGAAAAVANALSQERIQAYADRLEELVEQRTSDLAIQTERAEEANQAKSRFLANMSHELRTPLTAIVGYASVMVDGVFGELNDKQTDALNAVARSSDHLKTLIDDVLNLARIESGKEEAEPEDVAISEVLGQAHKLMMQTAIGKGVQLDPFVMPADIHDTMALFDRKHLHQILINLMSNAVKYTPPGGRVWLEVEKIFDKIKVSINDSGVGITQDQILKLFDRFERGGDTYSKSQVGTGIGLNLTRRLVELNGGRIGVESEPGEGSSFWVLLPVASTKATTSQAPTSAAPETESARLDGLSTVVVEDNPDTCEVLKHILLAAGATVRIANSVADGKALLEKEQPDILLTDLAIPGESGLEFIKFIRGSSGDLVELPIIVLSACAFDSDRDEALNAGASSFIPKPFRPQEVVKKVRQLTLMSAMEGN